MCAKSVAGAPPSRRGSGARRDARPPSSLRWHRTGRGCGPLGRGRAGESDPSLACRDAPVELRLPLGDLRPRARRREREACLATSREVGRIRRERLDARCEVVDGADLGEDRRLARDLGDRAARIARDDCAARLRLDDHPAELLDGGRRRAARDEHHVCASVDGWRARLPGATARPRAGLRRRGSRRARGPEPRRGPLSQRGGAWGGRRWRRARMRTASWRPFSGTSLPKSASTSSSAASDCAPGEEEVGLVAERQHLDRARESLAAGDGRRLRNCTGRAPKPAGAPRVRTARTAAGSACRRSGPCT